MSRRLIIVLVALVAAPLTAWSMACWAPPPPGVVRGPLPDSPGHTGGRSDSAFCTIEIHDRASTFSYGWPARCLEVEMACDAGQIVGVQGGATLPEWVLPEGRLHPYLPLRPIWTGLLVNAACWSVAAAGLMFVCETWRTK